MGMRIEVREEQFELAESLVQQMEESALEPNPDIDFHEADEEDIAYEKEVHEKEQEIINAKPSSIIYLLIFFVIVILFLISTFKL